MKKDGNATVLQTIIDTEKHPYRDWARFMLGHYHFKAGNFETSIKTLAPLLAEDDPSKYRAQALRYTGLSETELERANPPKTPE